jgi:hypothetical protein
MTLYVVYVPATGHVVGAVNVTGAVPPANVGELVGSALPMRISVDGEEVTLPLQANQLALLKADDEPEVFADPTAFGVVQVQGAAPKPTLVRLFSWDEELTLTTDTLFVTVKSANAENTPVLALISEGREVQVVAKPMRAGEDTVELPVTVSEGPHGVLVLVAGWTGAFRTVVTRSS